MLNNGGQPCIFVKPDAQVRHQVVLLSYGSLSSRVFFVGMEARMMLPSCEARSMSKKRRSAWRASAVSIWCRLRTLSGTPPVSSMQPSIGIQWFSSS